MKLLSSLAGSVALLLVIALNGSAAEKVSPAKSTASDGKYLLQYKFAMGEVLRYQVKHATNVRTTIDTTTKQVESHSDSVKAWKVTDVLPSGEMEFVHVVESVKMSNRSPDQPENKFDSTVDKTPPRGFEQAARNVGVPLLVIRIAPNGEVTEREEKLPQPPHSADMPITLELPKAPISIGEKWNHPYDVPATRQSGAKMQVQTRRVCKLRQVKNDVATIDVEYQILTPVDAYVRSQLIERLTEGTVRFDLARGRVLQQEHNVDKRVLGFAGKASSMHFVARLQERLMDSTANAGGVQTASAVSPAN